MKPNFIILIVVVLAAIGSAFFIQKQSPSPMVHYAPIDTEVPEFERQLAPQFTFVRYSDDQVLTFPDDARGKVVLLNFWASWCGPCIIEFPILIDVAAKFPEELIFLGISSDLTPEAMNNFFRKINYVARPNEWMAHDKGGSITNGLFQTFMLPETLLINQNGEIVKKYVGVNWEEADMVKDIENLLK